MLLTPSSITELLAAEEAQVADLNTSGDVGKESLEIDKAINVWNEETMLFTHMVEGTFESGEFLAAEKATSESVN